MALNALLERIGFSRPVPQPAATGKKPPSSAQPAKQAPPPRSAPAGPGASRPPQGEPPPAESPAPGAELISTYEKVPAHSAVLSLGTRPTVRAPAGMERSLLALENGTRRAMLLYDPEVDHRQMHQALASMRANLIGQGYKLTDRELPTKASVLAQLVNDTLRRQGEDTGDRNREISESRRLFERWIEIAAVERATDLHVEIVSTTRAQVRVRVDGELELLRDESGGQYPVSVANDAMAWAYNSGSGRGSNNQAQFDEKSNLYCMIEPRAVAGKQIALRYQSIRGYQGPKLVCRLLNVDANAPTLSYEQLGYSPSQEEMMRDVANMPAGFVLFAGVTGSGKTTTLKTFIETHPGNGTSAFYSVEDPVEYPLRGVHQITLQRDLMDKKGSAAKYGEVVAALMRADPDAVLMGEIRDEATAMAGQQIVETGHMACGTVHAHLISGILPRLTNDEVGMSREVLTNPNMLSLLNYQALVPLLCEHCKIQASYFVRGEHEGAGADEVHHAQKVVGAVDERFKLDSSRMFFRNIKGCEKCSHRGTRGLTVVAEMMIPDRRWLELSREKKDYEAVMHYREGSDGRFDTNDMTGKTVFEHSLYKALQGRLDPRQCERFDSFARFHIPVRQH